MKRINKINPIDRESYDKAKQRWDSIAKPLGSFGKLEKIIQKIAGIQGTENIDISKRIVVVMCGDNGVVAEGVTQCGNEVTAICAKEIAEGNSNVNAIAKAYKTDVIAIDMGMAHKTDCEKIINHKIADGTKNISLEPAMTPEQVKQAVSVGIDIVRKLKDDGINLIISGEMGIGNTTPSSAIASVLLGLPVEKVTGRGAGLSTEGFERKINAIKKAIEINSPDAERPLELLQKLGGFEIAGMTGLFIGGAYYKIPVIIDGVISAVSAAIAYKLNPLCSEYMLASHCSDEPAGKGLLELMGLSPIINANLRLGEGTGGLLLVPLLEGAVALYKNSHQFEEISIERYVELK